MILTGGAQRDKDQRLCGHQDLVTEEDPQTFVGELLCLRIATQLGFKIS